MTRVVHLAYADLHAGAAREGYRLHRVLRELGTDSRMIVAAKVGGDPTVLDSPRRLARWWAECAPLVDIAPLRALRPGQQELSLAWIGTGRARAVRALRPDVVQLHWINGGLVRPAALRRAVGDLPVVWWLADMWPFTGVEHYADDDGDWRSGFEDRSALDLDRRTFRRKQRAYSGIDRLVVVAPSRWLVDAARASAMFAGRRVELIATGTDLERWSPGDSAAARTRLGLPRDAKVVLFGAQRGGVNPRKGWSELVAAAARLSPVAGGRDVHVVVFGGAVAERLPVPVHEIGRIDDDAVLADAYRAADVFVAPSRQENLANTVLEATACGCPTVAFSIGGMPDMIEPGATGHLAVPFDPVDLAEGVDRVLGLDADSAAAMRERCRSLAVERFDVIDQARRYQDLYAELTS